MTIKNEKAAYLEGLEEIKKHEREYQYLAEVSFRQNDISSALHYEGLSKKFRLIKIKFIEENAKYLLAA